MSTQISSNRDRVKFAHTRKDKNEEGADSSNDADDVSHVRDKHGNEQSGCDPGHSQNNSAATLKGVCDKPSSTSLSSQHQVKDHRSAPTEPQDVTHKTHKDHTDKWSTHTSQEEGWWDRWWLLIFQKEVWKWSSPHRCLDMTSECQKRLLAQMSCSRKHLSIGKIDPFSSHQTNTSLSRSLFLFRPLPVRV